MILVDTSVWIEFFKRKEPYFTVLKDMIESNEAVTHEVVFGELLQGCKNDNETSVISNYWDNLQKPLDEEPFIQAGKLSSSLNLINKGNGLIDSVLIHLCREYNWKLWTLDKKIQKVLMKKEIYSLK